MIGATGDPAKKEAYLRVLGASEVVDSAPGFSRQLVKDTGGGVDMVGCLCCIVGTFIRYYYIIYIVMQHHP